MSKGRLRRGCAILVAIFLLAILLSISAYWWHLRQSKIDARAGIGAELERLRAEGMPLSKDELLSWDPVAEDENAAAYYLQAYEARTPILDPNSVVPYFGYGELPPLGETLSDEMTQAIGAFLAENEAALALVHEGANSPRLRFAPEGGDEADPSLSELQDFVGQLLMLEIVFAIKQAAPEQAIAAELALTNFANQLRQESTTWPLLLASSTTRDAADMLERILATVEVEDETLSRLQEAFERLSDPEMLTRTLISDRAEVLGPLTENAYAPPASYISEIADVLRDEPDSYYLYLTSTQERIDASRLQGEERRAAFDEIEKYVESLYGNPFSMVKYWAFILANIASTPFSSWHDSHQARVTTVVAGLAVARYELERGRLPESLTELTPQFLESLPHDPWSGGALRYKVEGGEALIYSIGENESDDGGAVFNYRNKGDIVFRVLRTTTLRRDAK
jgi:hypothetical protein